MAFTDDYHCRTVYAYMKLAELTRRRHALWLRTELERRALADFLKHSMDTE